MKPLVYMPFVFFLLTISTISFYGCKKEINQDENLKTAFSIAGIGDTVNLYSTVSCRVDGQGLLLKKFTWSISGGNATITPNSDYDFQAKIYTGSQLTDKVTVEVSDGTTKASFEFVLFPNKAGQVSAKLTKSVIRKDSSTSFVVNVPYQIKVDSFYATYIFSGDVNSTGLDLLMFKKMTEEEIKEINKKYSGTASNYPLAFSSEKVTGVEGDGKIGIKVPMLLSASEALKLDTSLAEKSFADLLTIDNTPPIIEIKGPDKNCFGVEEDEFKFVVTSTEALKEDTLKFVLKDFDKGENPFDTVMLTSSDNKTFTSGFVKYSGIANVSFSFANLEGSDVAGNQLDLGLVSETGHFYYDTMRPANPISDSIKHKIVGDKFSFNFSTVIFVDSVYGTDVTHFLGGSYTIYLVKAGRYSTDSITVTPDSLRNSSDVYEFLTNSYSRATGSFEKTYLTSSNMRNILSRATIKDSTDVFVFSSDLFGHDSDVISLGRLGF